MKKKKNTKKKEKLSLTKGRVQSKTLLKVKRAKINLKDLVE